MRIAQQTCNKNPGSAYHTPKAILADRYRAIESDGTRRTGKLSADGRMEPLGLIEPERQPQRRDGDYDEDDDDDEAYDDD